MRNILKRFSNKIHTNSSMILDGVIGIQDYEEQLSNYERCVYGKFDNNVEISKISSQREKLLLSRKLTFLEKSLTISGAYIILNLLTSLNTFKEILENEYRRELWWENVLGSRFGDAKPYKSALDKIERAYNDLIKEASVVVVVISSTLKDWYDRKLPLEAMDVADPTQKRFKDADFFFDVSQVIVPLKRACETKLTQLKEEADITSQVETQSVTATVEAPRSKMVNLSDYLFQQMLKVKDNVSALGLSSKKLVAVNKKKRSFWKSDQYQAELVFLQVDSDRAWKSVKPDDYHAQWNVIQTIAKKVNTRLSNLNVLFYRQTRQLYKDFRKGWLEKQYPVVREGLCNFLENGDILAVRRPPLKEWVTYLSPHLLGFWNVIETGLKNLEAMQGVIWKKALSELCDFLQMEPSLKSTVLTRLVTRYLVPAVKRTDRKTQHPAYQLIYQHAPSEAYEIMRPQFKDIVVHLRDNAAWENVEEAKNHLLFLMNPDAFNFERVCIVKMVCFKSIFSMDVNRVHWNRLASIKNTHDLLDESRELKDTVEAFQAFYTEDNEGEASLQDILLAQMSVDAVQELQVNQEAWKHRLGQWGNLIELLSEAFLETTHDYHVQAKHLFSRMAENLLILSHEFYIIRPVRFKQLLEFSQQQSFLDVGLRTALSQRLINWTVSDVPQDSLIRSLPSRPIEIVEETNVMQQVLQDLCMTMQKLYHILRSNQPELKSLLDRSLTRLELNALSRESSVVTHHEDKAKIINYLGRIHKTPQASVFCQKQASLLKQLLSCEIQEKKSALIEQYLDVVGRQEQATAGLFAEPDERLIKNDLRPRLLVIVDNKTQISIIR